jgi:hypothetical protein
MSLQTQVNPFFTPTQISDCSLWLDAADVNGNGNQPVNRSSVSVWRDKSGNNNNATAYATTTTFSNNGINFTGSQMMQTPLNSTMLTQSVFIVSSVSASGNQSLVSINSPNLNVGYAYILINYQQNVLRYGGTLVFSGSTATQNTRFLYGATMNSGSTSFLYFNGNQTGTNSSTPVISGSSGTVTLGAYLYTTVVPTPQEFLTGVINEVIIYNVILTTSQRQQVEGYLAWKWGLQGSLPATHPYKRSPIPPLLSPPTTIPATSTNPFFQATQIPGCRLWLDSTDSTTITLSGNRVTSWRDKTGINTSFSVNGSPTYVASPLLNSQNIVRFNGGSDYLFYNAFSISQPFTVFCVTVQRDSADFFYSFVLEPSIANSAVILFNVFNLTFYAGANATLTPNITYSLNLPGLYTAVFTGSRSFFGFNGTGNSNLNAGTLGWTNLYLGRDWSGIAQNQDVGEVIFYNSALTTAQRTQVEGYLAWKWGLQASLPATHPYKTSPIPPILNPPTIASKIISSSWSPLQISGCQLWMDGADLTSFTLSGSNITQWRDKSVNATPMNVSTGTPTLRNVNGRSSVFFNGSTRLESLNYTRLAGVSNINWFVVANIVNVNLTFGLTIGTQYTSNFFSQNSLLVDTNTLLLNFRRVSGSSRTFISRALTAGSVIAGSSVNFSTGVYSVSTNGTTTTSSGGPTGTQDSASVNLYIGNTNYAGESFITGTISECLLYTSSLTLGQQQQVEGYLAWKWGLQGSLPATHPFKRWPPPP